MEQSEPIKNELIFAMIKINGKKKFYYPKPEGSLIDEVKKPQSLNQQQAA